MAKVDVILTGMSVEKISTKEKVLALSGVVVCHSSLRDKVSGFDLGLGKVNHTLRKETKEACAVGVCTCDSEEVVEVLRVLSVMPIEIDEVGGRLPKFPHAGGGAQDPRTFTDDATGEVCRLLL